MLDLVVLTAHNINNDQILTQVKSLFIKTKSIKTGSKAVFGIWYMVYGKRVKGTRIKEKG
ncbi:MAG: hypothetical protein A2Y94_13375 [Caldithrix sp. RBG_13_44_9]|nr:MAG: hypothetical protein A2Y94_13375 [Caldithrix sp. RBG_13_44_9]